MKKMLSLAAMFAVLSYASPASAALNISGDASVRERGVFQTNTATNGTETKYDDVVMQYRVRINGAADLGDGYFFKAQLMNESPAAGGWQSVGYGNTETYTLGVSQFYFGRNTQDSHYKLGRLPLNSVNNPVFDLTIYPGNPLDVPVATVNNDRVLGVNVGATVGGGDLNATVIVLNNSAGTASDAALAEGLLNDGYAFHLSYKTNVGDVTLEPQFVAALTKCDALNQPVVMGAYYENGQPKTWSLTPPPAYTHLHDNIKPWTVGANAVIPAGDAKIGLGAFYTKGNGISTTNYNTSGVDYNGYLLRVKGEIGNFMAWYDFNKTTDNTGYNPDVIGSSKIEYTNNFVWAQYNFPVHKSAAGSFNLTPTVRYLTTKLDNASTGEIKVSRLRTELYATVTF